MSYNVVADNLVKKYGSKLVLDKISFKIKSGRISSGLFFYSQNVTVM